MQKFKKSLSLMLALIMTIGVIAVTPLNSSAVTDDKKPAAPSFAAAKGLYVHAAAGSSDTEAWQMWQSIHDEEFIENDSYTKFFFLPVSADSQKVEIYNGFDSALTVDGQVLAPLTTSEFSYNAEKSYELTVDEKSYTLKFMKSTAEAAIYVNNMDADAKGTPLIDYLSLEKSNSAKASGAIVSPDGTIDNTPIKKIKGRGNTTWSKAKKPFNITYSDTVSIAGMNKSKKYCLLANYQDDSLSRNRFLYDLADAADVPYASDSRYVDFYSNGYYYGSYQITEKIEVGKNSLIKDFSETDYLNNDGTVKENFPFLCEVDSGATEGEDYFVELGEGLKVTIKSPELQEDDPGYEEVKKYVKDRFEKFTSKFENGAENLSEIADIDSLAKLYIINELGKNWDAGVSSFYFTYKQDGEGKYKFYGSPVWDYDNSLGNANGVVDMLKYFGITDYTEPTGIWGEFALSPFAMHPEIMPRIKEIWFEKFVPAIDHFAGKKINDEIGKELYTADDYYKLVSGSAEMNYKSGWLLYTSGWIADHTKLQNAYYDSETNTYSVNKYKDNYKNNFEGMYNYCRDWLVSRAAWLSAQYGKDVKTVEVENRPENIDAAEVVPSGTKTKTLRFYFPDEWKCEHNPFYDGENLNSCKPGIYWWEGSYNCSDFYTENKGWPGYSISKTDKADSNIYVVTVPDDVETVVFNNMLKADDDLRELTRNVWACDYFPGENEFYPEGLESVDNMIFVPVRNESLSYEKNPYDGNWFYYYGDGKYGTYKTLAEAEENDAVYSGGEFPEIKLSPIEGCTVSGLKNKTYNGKAQTQSVIVKNGDTALLNGIDYILSYKNNKNAGTATMTIIGVGRYSGTIAKTFKIAKAKNTVKVTSLTKAVKISKLKKKAQTVKISSAVKKPQGKLSYKLTSVPKSLKKLVKINSKGVLTLQKWAKAKKGTCKIKIKVTAKGNKNYTKVTKTATVKIRIK